MRSPMRPSRRAEGPAARPAPAATATWPGKRLLAAKSAERLIGVASPGKKRPRLRARLTDADGTRGAGRWRTRTSRRRTRRAPSHAARQPGQAGRHAVRGDRGRSCLVAALVSCPRWAQRPAARRGGRAGGRARAAFIAPAARPEPGGAARALPRGHAHLPGHRLQRRAAAFYARHGVKVVDAAYESHENWAR